MDAYLAHYPIWNEKHKLVSDQGCQTELVKIQANEEQKTF